MDSVEEQSYVLGVQALLWGYPLVCYGDTTTAAVGAGASRINDLRLFPEPGTAPIDASSGDHVRHRLSRGGNRAINRVLHTMAIVQLCNPTEGRAEMTQLRLSSLLQAGRAQMGLANGARCATDVVLPRGPSIGIVLW